MYSLISWQRTLTLSVPHVSGVCISFDLMQSHSASTTSASVFLLTLSIVIVLMRLCKNVCSSADFIIPLFQDSLS